MAERPVPGPAIGATACLVGRRPGRHVRAPAAEAFVEHHRG
jgi:hypothetical protein